MATYNMKPDYEDEVSIAVKDDITEVKIQIKENAVALENFMRNSKTIHENELEAIRIISERENKIISLVKIIQDSIDEIELKWRFRFLLVLSLLGIESIAIIILFFK